MRPQIYPFIALSALTLAFFVVPLAGCGGGGGKGGGSTTASTPSPSATATPTPTPTASATPAPTLGQYTVTDITPTSIISDEANFQLQKVSENGKVLCKLYVNTSKSGEGIYSYDINTRALDHVSYTNPSGFTTYDIGIFNAVSHSGLSIGHITGFGDPSVDNYDSVFLYNTNTKQFNLLENNGYFSLISGINDNGDILNNRSLFAPDYQEATVLKSAGDGTYTKTFIGLPSGATAIFASHINNAGMVFGTVGNTNSGGNSYPFLWQNGVMTQISLPALSEVDQMTETGSLVGRRRTDNGNYVPFLWRNGASVAFALPNNDTNNITLANNQDDILSTLGTNVFLWKHDAYGAPLNLQSLLPSDVTFSNITPHFLFDDGRILLRANSPKFPKGWLFLLTPR